MPTVCVARQSIPAHCLVGLAIVVALAGCAARDGVRIPAGNRVVAESDALILPAAGGPAVLDVVERTYTNAVEQKVSLFTSSAVPGQNYLNIQMFGPMQAEHDGETRLGFRPVHVAQLAREMRQQVPGVPLRTSGLYLQNNYGPFGYAFGRSASGDACLYGWQQIRARDNERTMFQNRGNIQIRARVCDSEADERQLLALMYGYTISGTFVPGGWNPYGAPRPVDPTLGEDSSPILPREEELSTRPVPVAAPRVRRVAVENAAPAATAADVSGAHRQPAVLVPSPVAVEGAATQKGTPVVPAPGCVEGGSACN
ncbi:cellulose biosynthesis protein BcsN [Mycoplana rhizolycopersici]|uniref:cellulose biosynthesis protein BcsN n=1 Tax=Mycoplana rhizolycopersici TaxID=2746702 RepID=UPI001AED266C|nr:cellulose biosynthesis protein BcsN [Rhizobium rhizolycopersici]